MAWGWSNIFTREERQVILFIIGIMVIGTVVKLLVPEENYQVIEKKTEVTIFPLDLNKATPEQLEEVPGIGPATAEKIVKFREERGGFKRLEELVLIKGIGKKKLERWKPYLIVGDKGGKH